MKLKIIALALLCSIFIVQSCIPSIHPIYTEDKLVDIKEIPGVWVKHEDDGGQQPITSDEEKTQLSFKSDSGQPETWTFRKNGDKSYFLIVDEEGDPAAFDVHIIKLNENFFMDFFPADMPSEDAKRFAGGQQQEHINTFHSIHLFPVHTFAKMEIKGDMLTISMFDPDFLQKLLERRQIRIKHEETENGYILTASPEELQKFASKYAHVKEAFLDEPIVLKNKL